MKILIGRSSSFAAFSLVLLSMDVVASAQYVESDVRVLFERTSLVAGGYFGGVVVGLGDVNGDGIFDFATSDDWLAGDGRVSCFSGSDGELLWTLTQADSVHLGEALEAIDWDGDGVLDLVAGAPSIFDVAPQRTRVFLGPDGSQLADLVPRPFVSNVGFGAQLARGGDLNGDGVEDLLVGSRDTGSGGMMRAYTRGTVNPFTSTVGARVAFLGDTSIPADGRDEIVASTGGVSTGPAGEIRGLRWTGFLLAEDFVIQLPHFARDLAGGADVSGDGLPDFAAATADGVLVFSGVEGRLLRTLGGSADTVAFLADVDGDGYAEIAGGSPNDGSGARGGGKITIWSGATGAVLRTITSNVANRHLGADIRAIPDFDGDGVADLLAGAESRLATYPAGSVLVFSLGRELDLNLDFETEDDLATPLVNGQHVDTEFGELVVLTSRGPNAGLGIFDSDPSGPNAGSQDPDLLVDTGNLLILQTENAPPNPDDVFPLPNDDDDGGTITFVFSLAVEALSVRLIDCDASDGTWSVTLTDGAGRQRVFTVPSNWTGDRALGQSGSRMLDLASLDPQAGFGSAATATQDPLFRALDVRQIAFVLAGSGAIDDLHVLLRGLPLARVTPRNGAGVNPVILSSDTAPVLGRTWTAALDASSLGTGIAALIVRSGATSGAMSRMGETLVTGPLLATSVRPHSGTVVELGWLVPFDLSLCGFEAHAQGLCSANERAVHGPPGGSDAVLTNALDLVLGF